MPEFENLTSILILRKAKSPKNLISIYFDLPVRTNASMHWISYQVNWNLNWMDQLLAVGHFFIWKKGLPQTMLRATNPISWKFRFRNLFAMLFSLFFDKCSKMNFPFRYLFLAILDFLFVGKSVLYKVTIPSALRHRTKFFPF